VIIERLEGPSLGDVVAVARRGARVELGAESHETHAAGTGAFGEPEVVRAMMIRVKTLAMGYSGVRLQLVEASVDMLNCGLVPAVPEHGSLGASGHLAPLAYVGVCMCGEGWALKDGKAVPAGEALRRAGLKTANLEAKEGLSLINGTDGMLGMLILALDDLQMLLDTAELTTAMTVEALLGTDRVFAEELHSSRPHPGQAASARDIRRLLEESPIVSRVAPGLGPPRAGCPLAEVRVSSLRGGAEHFGLRRAGRPARAFLHDGQPAGSPQRSGRKWRQLPRRAARLRVRLPRQSGGGGGGRNGEADRSPTGPLPIAGPAALLGAPGWDELWLDDSPLHRRVLGRGKPSARHSRQRRLPAHLRHAGGPLFYGIECWAQAAPGAGEHLQHLGRRGTLRRLGLGSAVPSRAWICHQGRLRTRAVANTFQAERLFPGTRQVKHVTRESDIELKLDPNLREATALETGIAFFDHMLEMLAWHASMPSEVRFDNRRMPLNHLVTEDVGIVLGRAVAEMLAGRASGGVRSVGKATRAMDEALAQAVLSFEGRANHFLELDLARRTERVEDMLSADLQAFLEGFAQGSRGSVHVYVHRGSDPHHMWEAAFRAFGWGLRHSLTPDSRMAGRTAGVKGTVE
jgi:imidazoleglycerol phosphate dehydratase HisB